MRNRNKVILLAFVLIGLISLVLYRSLMFTYEVAIHQMRGETENVVFISPDGHMEGVYGPDGNAVVNLYNKGSYNYCHPFKEPICHFIKDMLPWLMWGNDRNDPTSFGERLSAYIVDFSNGFFRSIKLYSGDKTSTSSMPNNQSFKPTPKSGAV